MVFNYELYGHYSMSVLAEGLLRAAFKVYGSEKARLLIGEKEDFELSKDQHACSELILDSVKSHKSSFRNLSNIYKFSEESILKKIEEYFKYC